MSFLGTVARARPRKPINGLLVAVPITDVGAETEEGALELGRRMRERVDEVMARLQVVLPVYVLLTKCDLLPGFVESFADLRKGDRGQVWGVTIPLAAGPDRAATFGESFDELLAVVEERGLKRLADERQEITARAEYSSSPSQLAAVKPQLGAFLEALFTENVYQESRSCAASTSRAEPRKAVSSTASCQRWRRRSGSGRPSGQHDPVLRRRVPSFATCSTRSSSRTRTSPS